MDLVAARKAAEAVLAGKDSDNWHWEAQEQARNVLGIVGAVGEAEAALTELRSEINSELATLRAEKGDLASQIARTKDAEAKQKDLASELESLKKAHKSLQDENVQLKGLVESVRHLSADLSI